MITEVPFKDCKPHVFRELIVDHGVIILRSAISLGPSRNRFICYNMRKRS